jgi:hypothetical protein
VEPESSAWHPRYHIYIYFFFFFKVFPIFPHFLAMFVQSSTFENLPWTPTQPLHNNSWISLLFFPYSSLISWLFLHIFFLSSSMFRCRSAPWAWPPSTSWQHWALLIFLRHFCLIF